MMEGLRLWLMSLEPWGAEVIVWAQMWSTPLLDRVFHFAAFLGDEEFLLLLLPLVYWSVDKKIGRWLAYSLLLSTYLNSVIKHIFMIPRPADPRIVVMRPVAPPNPCFPSGHAQNGVTLWALVANRFRRAAVWVAAVAIMVLVGSSRIYLGVHFPSSVIGGWLLGAVYLGLFLLLAPRAERWLVREPLALKLMLAVALPIAALLLHGPDLRGLYPAPDAAAVSGTLLGMSVGFLLEPRWVGFRVDGPWSQRLVRVGGGLMVVAIFWQGPKLLLPESMPHGLSIAARFVRYGASGLAGTLLVPWLAVRTGLAGSESEVPVGLRPAMVAESPAAGGTGTAAVLDD